MTTSDLDLLNQYAREGSEAAFATLVRRHLDLVYSAGLRQVRSPQLAEEVAQSVFADLARKASALRTDTILTAWLYQVTRRTAVDVIRRESRRQQREQLVMEAADMKTDSAEWTEIAPLLDEAMDLLDATDRSAILLRYFENKNLREVGATLGTSEDAAQKRVSRAVERLREILAKRGIAIGTGGLVAVVSANAVQAAPAGLLATISTPGLLTAAAATKIIAMTALQKTIVTGLVALAIGTSIYGTQKAIQEHHAAQALREEQAASSRHLAELKAENERLSQLTGQTNAGQTAESLKTAANAVATDLASQLRAALKLPDGLRQKRLEEIAATIAFSEMPNAVDLAISVLTNDGDRIAFLMPLMHRWAEHDPVAALDFALNYPLAKANAGAQEWFLGNILNTWAQKDPDGAMDWLEKLPEGQLRQKLFMILLGVMAQNDPQKAIARIKAMPNGPARDQALQQLGYVLAGKNPKAAAEFGKTLPASVSRDQFLRQVMNRWMESDPKSAVDFIMALPASGSRDDLIRSAVAAWARNDPQAAAKYSETMPINRMWGMTGVAYNWALKDPDAAWKWSLTIADDETRRSSLGGVLRSMATHAQMEEAAKYASQLTGDDQVRAVRSLLIDTSDIDPDWTARWVATFPTGETRNQAVEKLVQHWSMTDPMATAQWLSQQPRDQSYQDGARRLIPGMLKASPSTAWDWAMVLTDPATKQQQMEIVAKSWMGTDPDGARKKIQASGLPSDQVSTLLGR